MVSEKDSPKYYHENGTLKTEGNVKNGEAEGLWQFYDENGKLIKKETYKNGELIKREEF